MGDDGCTQTNRLSTHSSSRDYLELRSINSDVVTDWLWPPPPTYGTSYLYARRLSCGAVQVGWLRARHEAKLLQNHRKQQIPGEVVFSSSIGWLQLECMGQGTKEGDHARSVASLADPPLMFNNPRTLLGCHRLSSNSFAKSSTGNQLILW